jgi:hypothetical protein
MPLLLIALVVWASRYAGRLPRATAVAAAVAAAAVAFVPVGSFLNGNAITDSFGLLAVWRPQLHHSIPLDWLTLLLLLLALVAVALFVLVPARFALAVPVLVLLFLAFATREANPFLVESGTNSRNGGIQVAQNDWIDRAVGVNANVTVLFTNARPPQVLWLNEFFNRSVHSVYNFAGPVDSLPQQTVAPDPKTGRLLIAGVEPLHAQYVLTDTSQFLAGVPIAEDTGAGVRLYRVDGLVREIGGLSGIYSDGWSGPTASFSANGCPGGRLTMRLTGDPDLQPKPQTIRARSGTKLLGKIVIQPRHFRVPFSVPLVSSNGVCEVRFTVSPTAVPADVLGRPDARELGIRFQDVTYEPKR